MYEQDALGKAAKLLKKSGLRMMSNRSGSLAFQRGNGGKNAWLSRYEGKWIFGTWAPFLYILPDDIDLPKLCLAFIEQQGGMWSLDEVVCAAFNIKYPSKREFNRVYNGLYPGRRDITARLRKLNLVVKPEGRWGLAASNPKNGRLTKIYKHTLAHHTWIIAIDSVDYYVLLHRAILDVSAEYLLDTVLSPENLVPSLISKYELKAKDSHLEVTSRSFKYLDKLRKERKFVKERFEMGAPTEEIQVRCENRVNVFIDDLVTLARAGATKPQILDRARDLAKSFQEEAWFWECRRLLDYITNALASIGIYDWMDFISIPNDIFVKRRRLFQKK